MKIRIYSCRIQTLRKYSKDVNVIEEKGSSNLQASLVDELERIHTKYHDGSNDEKRVIYETLGFL